MRGIVTLLVAATSCAQVEGRIDEPGAVYLCSNGLEYCYRQDSADEVGELLGMACDNIQIDDRVWPWFAGCWYHCGPERGCNATGGCICPAEMP